MTNTRCLKKRIDTKVVRGEKDKQINDDDRQLHNKTVRVLCNYVLINLVADNVPFILLFSPAGKKFLF